MSHRAILGKALHGKDGPPALLDVKIKPFPWPAVTIDLGAAAAAVAFNLLLVFAFIVPTRTMVATIVREKELRLREGMRIFGLQVYFSQGSALRPSLILSDWVQEAKDRG